MRERLVEDWLTRIHERGYDVAFCQTLLAKGRHVLRAGHGPTEHGKDVIAVSSDRRELWAYQLKSGNFSQADVTKHLEQLRMLVETRPSFPGMSLAFHYNPVLVTTGEFREPAISLIKELNQSWQARGLPELAVINGRSLLADLLALSSDFWPVLSLDVRTLRSLYLSEGVGDFDPAAFSRVLLNLVRKTSAKRDIGRQAAAANLFANYLLAPFLESGDHWSVFRGWTICAACIAWAGCQANQSEEFWRAPFGLACDAGVAALAALRNEARDQDQFRPNGYELDDYTRLRNVTTIAAVACIELFDSDRSRCSARVFIDTVKRFIADDRLLFWGEGALSQFMMLVWYLERHDEHDLAKSLLVRITATVVSRSQRDSNNPLPDAYVSADECLRSMYSEVEDGGTRKVVESHSLFNLVTLCARRNLRSELSEMWRDITHVRFTWVRADNPSNVLQWECEDAIEHSQQFFEYSWRDLHTSAIRPDQDRLPPILWSDTKFALMYLLAFQHRMMTSLFKRLDDVLSTNVEVAPRTGSHLDR